MDKTDKVEGDRISGLRLTFLDLLDKFLRAEEGEKEKRKQLLRQAWRILGVKNFFIFGFDRDSDVHFGMYLEGLEKREESSWGLLLQGMNEAQVGFNTYREMKNLSPFADCLLVFSNPAGDALVFEYEVRLAFGESAGRYPYAAVIAVSVKGQRVVVF